MSTATYEYRYASRMTIRTTNGCVPNGSRLEQTGEGILETSIYPNPVSNGRFTVQLPTGYNQAKVVVTDLQGKIVKNLAVSNATSEIVLENISAGLYLVNISTADFTKTHKIVVTR